MKRSLLMVATCVLLLGIVGCQPTEYNVYDTLEELCERAEHNELAQVSGVLKLPEAVIYDDHYHVLLVEDLSQDQPWLSLRIKKGKGNNRMEPLPDTYTYDDFKVHTASGEIAGHGDTVTVSGRYLSGCSLTVYVAE
jgi:hypothetical protein